MALFGKLIKQGFIFALGLIVCAGAIFAQQAAGTLRGQIKDEFGGLIIGATVTLVDSNGAEKTATTNDEGVYVFNNLAPGTYTVRAQAGSFALFEDAGVSVEAGRPQSLNITLQVQIQEEKVTVSAEPPVSTDPENNAGALVLRGADIDALPDDPDELADALQALAGPSAGPNGGQIYIDGFTGGRLPPRSSIREIRINQNPFSAEYDRLGFGRIEILTKPGTDKFRGQAFFNFNDESLNSRNPFAPDRAAYQSRQYGGNLSGPLVSKKASFFFDFEKRDIDDNDIISAIILDPTLTPTPFNQSVLTPQRRTTFSPRLDYQLNDQNTLVARYTYTRRSAINSGVGNFNLLSRAFDSSSTEHTFQLTETAIINPKTINETRFQFSRESSEQNSDNSLPSIRVLDAFTGGGAQTGDAFDRENRWELTNTTSLALGNHSVKFGARLRRVSITDFSPNNFGGTFTFAGRSAPLLDANNQVVLGADGQPIFVPISSIESYRRTLLFQQQGLTPAEVRALGGGPSQFTIAGGDPLAGVSQTDLGLFILDDWRVRPNFTLSAGLRYEAQSNINSHLNFAPRLSFAWSPGAGGNGQSKTVVRGGAGVFYDRIGENLTLQALRFNGINQQQYIVTDPTVLDAVQFTLDGATNVPGVAQLSAFAARQTTTRLAADLQAPYTIQSALSIERQLPYNFTFSATYINARTLHLLRSRNINAPLPGTFIPGDATSGVRPFGDTGNIYEYESSGRLNQNQLIVGVNNRLNRNFSLFARYILAKASSDTDGVGTFPANTYDLSTEYGRSALDVRHRFILGGTVNAPWGIRLNPFVIASSGRPFNITTGRDTNGDTLFTERPAFAPEGADCSSPDVRCTAFGNFILNPLPGQEIIPRNYGTGPSFFTVNLGINRTFGFGGEQSSAAPSGSGDDGGGRRGGGFGGIGGGRRGGGGGGGGRSGGGGESGSRYTLSLGVQMQNLLNNTNFGTPIGNLSSTLFGASNTTAGGFGGGGGNQSAGNRRIIGQIRFSF